MGSEERGEGGKEEDEEPCKHAPREVRQRVGASKQTVSLSHELPLRIRFPAAEEVRPFAAAALQQLQVVHWQLRRLLRQLSSLLPYLTVNFRLQKKLEVLRFQKKISLCPNDLTFLRPRVLQVLGSTTSWDICCSPLPSLGRLVGACWGLRGPSSRDPFACETHVSSFLFGLASISCQNGYDRWCIFFASRPGQRSGKRRSSPALEPPSRPPRIRILLSQKEKSCHVRAPWSLFPALRPAASHRLGAGTWKTIPMWRCSTRVSTAI
jgi:hypothetical protein